MQVLMYLWVHIAILQLSAGEHNDMKKRSTTFSNTYILFLGQFKFFIVTC